MSKCEIGLLPVIVLTIEFFRPSMLIFHGDSFPISILPLKQQSASQAETKLLDYRSIVLL